VVHGFDAFRPTEDVTAAVVAAAASLSNLGANGRAADCSNNNSKIDDVDSDAWARLVRLNGFDAAAAPGAQALALSAALDAATRDTPSRASVALHLWSPEHVRKTLLEKTCLLPCTRKSSALCSS